MNRPSTCTLCHIIYVLVFIVFLTSCKSNPVTSQPDPDPVQTEVISTANYNWSYQTYGTSGMHFDSPIRLNKDDLSEDLLESLKDVMSSTETYLGMINDVGMLMSNHAIYQDNVPLILEGAAEGSITEMLRSVNGNLIELNRKDLTFGTKKGILQEGSTHTTAGTLEFKNLIILEAPKMWQVSVIYQADDLELREVASRIIESVEFR